MIAIDPSVARGVVGSFGLILLYGFSFWRIFKRNPGNRVIECGSITLMIFAVMIALFRIPNFPTWIVAWLGLLVFLLGLLTIFFLLQQGYRALRRSKTN
jgi:O-antigen/teichoic acid export membrane protein